jgi:ornithine carbamoyltransferase
MEYFNDPGYAAEKDKRCKIMMPYQVNQALLEGRPAKIMHDMPIHPDYEIAEDMIEHPNSIIYDQAENRLDAQKAIMLHVLHQVK